VCVFACVCVCERERECVCVCARTCARTLAPNWYEFSVYIQCVCVCASVFVCLRALDPPPIDMNSRKSATHK